jgi:histidinol-phosphate aminotransferase
MENSFDINNLVRENVKTMKPYSSRDEFKDFDVAQMIFLTPMKIHIKME